MKKSLVHDISFARQFAIKMLVAIATLFGFNLFSTDSTKAYIQSEEAINCDLFINLPQEFELVPMN